MNSFTCLSVIFLYKKRMYTCFKTVTFPIKFVTFLTQGHSTSRRYQLLYIGTYVTLVSNYGVITTCILHVIQYLRLVLASNCIVNLQIGDFIQLQIGPWVLDLEKTNQCFKNLNNVENLFVENCLRFNFCGRAFLNKSYVIYTQSFLVFYDILKLKQSTIISNLEIVLFIRSITFNIVNSLPHPCNDTSCSLSVKIDRDQTMPSNTKA